MIYKRQCNIYRDARSALEHENLHPVDKPLSYPLSTTHQDHIQRKHSKTIKEKVHTCVVCPKVYKNLSGLRRHYSSNHKELGVDYTVACDICGKTCVTKNQLKEHKQTHTGFKPYECNICNKSFSKNDSLKAHKRGHTGEKPYVCNYCNKSFAHGGSYRYHLKLHTGEVSHFCVNCNKGYISLSNLRFHMKKCREINIKSEIDIKSEPLETK
uniref:Oocyte zinc finger protein XlCOF6-like n=1 Tax=Diabrotica virgifera virgifera TaxID=50390 RepID=A0A6P7EZP3_DIAVI